MGKFISGIFFFAISVAAFCFGTYFLYLATHTDDAASVIVGVIFIELLGDLTKVSGKFANIAKRAPRVQKYYQDLNMPS